MPPSTINLPPLPSYTEVCTPTTPVLTNTISSASSVRSMSPATSTLLTSTAAAAQPTRAPLHEIPAPSVLSPTTTAASESSVNYSFLPSMPPPVITNPQLTPAPTTPNINNNFLQNLHPTNPFKESLEAEYRAHNPDSPLFRPNNPSQSEFGLPPFSDIYHSANSISRDRPSTTTSSTTTTTPMSPMMNVVQEIRSKISNPNNL
uniref:Uncharacterized protein n=1 Tax=Panagrolaimus davidi TaxID=227884 RepID=A0A914QQT6_9BILA